MDDNDKVRFAQLMLGLAEDCGSQLTKPGIAMKFDALRRYSIEQVEAAVMSVMRSNVYTKMPTTGTIIQAIEGTESDRSDIQIRAIRDEIRRIGSYGSPHFDDPVTRDLISRRFSWGAICSMTERDFAFFSNSFKESYAAHSKESSMFLALAGSRPVMSLPLSGPVP